MILAVLIVSSLSLIASLLVLAGATAILVALKKSFTEQPLFPAPAKPQPEAPQNKLRVVEGGEL